MNEPTLHTLICPEGHLVQTYNPDSKVCKCLYARHKTGRETKKSRTKK